VVAHAWQDPVHHTARRTGFSWQNRSSTPNFSELSAFARFLRCPGLWFESTAKTKDALPLLLLAMLRHVSPFQLLFCTVFDTFLSLDSEIYFCICTTLIIIFLYGALVILLKNYIVGFFGEK
jgi:hypothetical protein